MKIIAKRLNDMPIKNKLLLAFLLLIILPVMLIGFFSFYTSKGLLKQKTEQYTSDVLMETGENVDVKLREIERLSFQIVSSMPIQQSLRKANKGVTDEYEKIDVEQTIDTQLKGFLTPELDIAAIRIISLSGITYYVNPGSIAFGNVDGEKEILEKGVGSAVWFKTEPRYGTITVGRAINSIVNQEMIGFLFINLRESSLYNIYKKTELFKNGEIYIIDKEGSILSHKDKKLLNTFVGDAAEGITLDSLRDNFITASVNSKMYYIASRAINNAHWKIIAIIPTEQYEGDILRLRSWTIIICASCCLLALLISLALSGSISLPLRKLSSMMERVGKGDFSVSISYDSKDEVGILSSHFNKMVAQVQKLIQEVYQEQYLTQKAELKSLRMQINPHFLYNTLESINWMARIKGAPEIGDMVKALGDLMRVSISGEDFIPVGEEVGNVVNYLKIQNFRYGDRFEVRIHIEPDIEKILVPKLILQPIVENAIVHGLEEKVGNGRIEITGVLEEGNIVITVADNGVGMEEEKAAVILDDGGEEAAHGDNHTHIGLKNVDRRIKLYYGQQYGLSVASVPGSGTTVRAVLPMEQN
jgi:two-component system sensor histidine kinase YesM